MTLKNFCLGALTILVAIVAVANIVGSAARRRDAELQQSTASTNEGEVVPIVVEGADWLRDLEVQQAAAALREKGYEVDLGRPNWRNVDLGRELYYPDCYLNVHIKTILEKRKSGREEEFDLLNTIKLTCDIRRLDLRDTDKPVLRLTDIQEYLSLCNPCWVYFGAVKFDQEILRDLRIPPGLQSAHFESCSFEARGSPFLDCVAVHVSELSIRWCKGVNFSDLKPSERITSLGASNKNCPEDLAELLRLFPNLRKLHLRIQGASSQFIASIRSLKARGVDVRILMQLPTKLDPEAERELRALDAEGIYVDYPG